MKKYFKLIAIAILMTGTVYANFLVVMPEQVNVTHDGMFVTVDGLPVAIESLNIANDGYLVAIPSLNAAICPRCRRDTYTKGRTCSYCGFPITNKKAE